MISLLVIVHVIVCILLIALVLVQRGRGGGLVESFAGVESMFGTKTNTFLTRSTTILSVVFFFTCLSLAVLSVRQSRSLLSNVKPAPMAVGTVTKQEEKAAIPAETGSSASTQANPKTLDTTKPEQK